MLKIHVKKEYICSKISSMNYYIKYIKLKIALLSIISPKQAGIFAFNIFQKVLLKKPKKRELPFYQKAKSFKLTLENDTLHCYSLGNPDNQLVFMVHGWNSNAGSLSLFAEALAQKGYYIVTFDLLGHHKSTKKHTNLVETKAAFKALIKHINPQTPFSVIGHSFGASALAYTLSETDYKVDKIVLLSSFDYIIEAFRDFQKYFKLKEGVFQAAKNYIDSIIKEDFAQMRTSTKLKAVTFEKLLIIHDKKDKVIPFENALQIANEFSNATLIPFERIGHYRMLWNKEVVKETVNFISE